MNYRVPIAVFRKEMKNAFRDRRTLYSTFLVPLLLPMLILLPMALMRFRASALQEKPSKVAVLSPERYPDLAKSLSTSGKYLIIGVENAERALRRGYIDCALQIESGPKQGGVAEVLLIYDGTKEESSAAADKVKTTVHQFSDSVAREHLRTLNLDPSVFEPVVLRTRNAATATEMGGFLLGVFVAVLAVVGTILGGMTLAIDATAGEKERKTLEALIASPATRNQLVTGKFLATLAMAMLSVCLMILSLAFVLRFATVIFGQAGEQIAVRSSLSAGMVALLFVSLFLVASLLASAEMAISLLARSFREAQSYLAPLTIIAVLPVVFMQVLPSNPPYWMFFIPLVNEILLIRELFTGIPETSHIAGTLLSSLAYAIVGLQLAFRIFHRESVVMR